ncbi:hypothetical protein SDC9_156835 [bioreactor metagenome]|uniref:Uncharacterized protein n=1 Tax=bioreactor metagenome TaxID=1076179 RepID=A0A645FAG2_9ZZZZ
MHASEVDKSIFVMLHEHKAKKYRKPNQQQRTTDKPFPQSEVTYAHQFQSRDSQKYQNKKRRNPKTVVYKVAGQLRSP